MKRKSRSLSDADGGRSPKKRKIIVDPDVGSFNVYIPSEIWKQILPYASTSTQTLFSLASATLNKIVVQIWHEESVKLWPEYYNARMSKDSRGKFITMFKKMRKDFVPGKCSDVECFEDIDDDSQRCNGCKLQYCYHCYKNTYYTEEFYCNYICGHACEHCRTTTISEKRCALCSLLVCDPCDEFFKEQPERCPHPKDVEFKCSTQELADEDSEDEFDDD